MKRLNKEEAVLFYSAIAALVVALLVEFKPDITQGLLDSIYNIVVVAGPVIGGALVARSRVYSQATVEKMTGRT